jgi:hypothetical protein
LWDDHSSVAVAPVPKLPPVPALSFALDQLRQLLAGLHLVQLPLFLL